MAHVTGRCVSGASCSGRQAPSAPLPIRQAAHHSVARRSARARASIGPVEPPSRRVRKPEWVRILEDDADVDDDVARLLEGTDGDPDLIREKMKAELSRSDMFMDGLGSERPPRVRFRQYNPFALWVWFEFDRGAPTQRELDMLQTLLQSWFTIGKFGAFNSQNMQVFYNAGDDQSFFEYDTDQLMDTQGSLLHGISELETQGDWARCRIDLGTCDELALDALINCLAGFSRDVLGLKQVVIGGQNRDWPVPETGDREGDEEELPEGLDEEFDLLNELQAEQDPTLANDTYTDTLTSLNSPYNTPYTPTLTTPNPRTMAAQGNPTIPTITSTHNSTNKATTSTSNGGSKASHGGSSRKSSIKELAAMDLDTLSQRLASGEESLTTEGLEELLREREAAAGGGVGVGASGDGGESVGVGKGGGPEAPQTSVWGQGLMRRYSEQEFKKVFRNKS